MWGVSQLCERQSAVAGCDLRLSAAGSMSQYSLLFLQIPWIIWPLFLQEVSPIDERIASDSRVRDDSLGEIKTTLPTWHV